MQKEFSAGYPKNLARFKELRILRIDIAIPVYNEEATIDSQIRKLHKVLTAQQNELIQFKILITDNGSTDRTLQIAESLAASMDLVRVISVEQKGVGLALKKAWKDSDADIVGYMDLDLATDVIHLEEVILGFLQDESDVINASRLLPSSKVLNRKVSRTISSRGLNYIIRLIFRTRISDAMCGFKFIKRNVLEIALVNGASSNGWFFATQFLLVSEMMGFRVKEIPVTWIDDGNSKVRIMSLSKQYLSEIIELRRYVKNSSYRDFLRL
jgi:glycosyltransferase involved in cell wall biosynthesis